MALCLKLKYSGRIKWLLEIIRVSFSWNLFIGIQECASAEKELYAFHPEPVQSPPYLGGDVHWPCGVDTEAKNLGGGVSANLYKIKCHLGSKRNNKNGCNIWSCGQRIPVYIHSVIYHSMTKFEAKKTSLRRVIGAHLSWATKPMPLIPSIPIITDPIASNAPPLPILQVPTPPLASPPFTGRLVISGPEQVIMNTRLENSQ